MPLWMIPITYKKEAFMKTILIVDDEKKILSVFGKILCREGYNIIKTGNAQEAHEMLMRNHVDLVLLDINMPKVDGAVLYEIIDMFFKEIKVIVASVYPLEDQKMIIKGAVDYYDKSDSLKVLIEKVRMALSDTHKKTPEGLSGISAVKESC
jgi:DNA-binding NtrC family response regulator